MFDPTPNMANDGPLSTPVTNIVQPPSQPPPVQKATNVTDEPVVTNAVVRRRLFES